MIEPTEAIQYIYTLCKLIYDHVQVVKGNQAQCQRLAERVQKIVLPAVQGLEKIKDCTQFKGGLNAICTCLAECESFIKSYTDSNKLYKYLLRTGTYKEKFEELNMDLQKAMQQLNLGLNAQQIINREQDKQDQEKDYSTLIKQQDEIINLIQGGMQRLEMQQHEQHEITMQQFRSLKAQFAAHDIHKVPLKPPIDPKLLVPYYDLAFDKKIGEGSFGKIYLGKWNEQLVVIKMINVTAEDEKEQFIREVNIMSRLRNANIVQFYGACLEPSRCCIVMDYLQRGSLYDLLLGNNNNYLTLEQQKQIAFDIACGLHYLHSQNVLHRDFKSANILLTQHWQAKITDFGLAKTRAASIKSINQRSQAIEWLAPECFKPHEPYTEKSDIYSFGIILWEIFTGQQPYKNINKNKLIDYIAAGNRENIPNTVPPLYAELIKICWYDDPSARPDLPMIIQKLQSNLTALLETDTSVQFNMKKTKMIYRHFQFIKILQGKAFLKLKHD